MTSWSEARTLSPNHARAAGVAGVMCSVSLPLTWVSWPFGSASFIALTRSLPTVELRQYSMAAFRGPGCGHILERCAALVHLVLQCDTEDFCNFEASRERSNASQWPKCRWENHLKKLLWCVLLRLGWPSKSSTASTPTCKFESCRPSERLRLIPFWLLAAYLSHLAFSNKHFFVVVAPWVLCLLEVTVFLGEGLRRTSPSPLAQTQVGPFHIPGPFIFSGSIWYAARRQHHSLQGHTLFFLHNSLVTRWPTDFLSLVQSTGCFRDRASCGWLWGGMQTQAQCFSMSVPWLWGRSGRICCGASSL